MRSQLARLMHVVCSLNMIKCSVSNSSSLVKDEYIAVNNTPYISLSKMYIQELEDAIMGEW